MSRPGESRDAAKGVSLYCEIDGAPVTLLAEDLTTAGFFVQTTTPKPMDHELEIVVRSSVGELVALGQVVQVVDGKRARAENRRAGYGVLFISLEDDQRAFIGLSLDAIDRQLRAEAKQRTVPPSKAPSGVQPAPAKSLPPAPSPTATHELKRIAAELRAELTKLQGKTAWTALGLEADAPLQSAKDAFLDVSKRFHPHKFARHNSAEVTKLATEVFIAYKRSYSVLTKLAPRTSPSPAEALRSPRPMTSIAPTAATSLRPDAPRTTGNRPRSR